MISASPSGTHGTRVLPHLHAIGRGKVVAVKQLITVALLERSTTVIQEFACRAES